MIPQPQSEYTEQPVVALSPGKRLQRSREMAGLSQVDVAHSLRLPLNVVQALEEDRHDGIHSTYLKGYLRAYARLVGVSTDLVVADVRQTLADRQAEILRAQLEQPKIDSSHRLIKAVSYALGASLLLLAVLWWRGQHSDEATALESAAIEAPAEPVPLVPTLPPAPAAEEASVAETAPAPESETPAPAETAAVPAAAAASHSEAQAAATAAVDAQPVPPAEAQADSEERGMVLRFSGDSWTEISDAKGKRLYKKLAKSGETVKIAAGEVPYRVTVGNAPSIAMSFDGKSIDLNSLSRNGVARFKIGADGVTHK